VHRVSVDLTLVIDQIALKATTFTVRSTMHMIFFKKI
jgi:hypothetical protein